MGWETRRPGRGKFYYRVERRNGKVVKTYVGPRSSPAVEIVARIDRNRRALDRLKRSAEAADDTTERDRLLQADDTRAALINDIIRRRSTMRASITLKKTTPAGKLPSRDDFFVLVHRADDGDEHAQEELVGLLDRHPELWTPFGDLGKFVEDHLLELATKESVLLRESVRRFFEKIRTTLVTVDQDPLDAFLVHRVVVSQLEALICQTELLDAHSEGANRRRQRRLDRAQRRLIESVEAIQRYRMARDGIDESETSHKIRIHDTSPFETSSQSSMRSGKSTDNCL